MFLNNVYSVSVIEKPIIRHNNKKELIISAERNTKSYEMYLLKTDENCFVSLDNKNTKYIYCNSVKEYIENGIFQNTNAIIYHFPLFLLPILFLIFMEINL